MNESQREIRVVALCGSLREKSYTRFALQVALDGVALTQAHGELIDLRNYRLPMCAGNETDTESYPHVALLCSIIKNAHGVILGTPEYHGGYSGVLKNALDLMGFDEWEGKVIGLIGVAGGDMGAVNAINGLRTAGRNLHSLVIPEQVSIPSVYKFFDEGGHCNDDKLKQRLMSVGRQVARMAYLSHLESNQQFIKAWEESQTTPDRDVD